MPYKLRMSSTGGWQPSQTAAAFCNQDFILIETFSGHRRKQRDSTVPSHFLLPSASDEALGLAVLTALAASRQIPPEEFATFFDLRAGADQDKQWIADLQSRYGYQTKRALFKGPKNVSISIRNEQVDFMPFRQQGMASWIRTKDDPIEDVVISANSTPDEVGKALRQAFANCL